MMFLDHYPTPLFLLFRHRDLCEYDRPAVLQNRTEVTPDRIPLNPCKAPLIVRLGDILPGPRELARVVLYAVLSAISQRFGSHQEWLTIPSDLKDDIDESVIGRR